MLPTSLLYTALPVFPTELVKLLLHLLPIFLLTEVCATTHSSLCYLCHLSELSDFILANCVSYVPSEHSASPCTGQ